MDLLQQLYQLEFVCRKFWGNTTNESGLRSKRSASANISALPRKKKEEDPTVFIFAHLCIRIC